MLSNKHSQAISSNEIFLLDCLFAREVCYTLLKILAGGAVCAAVCINMFLELMRTCIMKPDSATSHTLFDLLATARTGW